MIDFHYQVLLHIVCDFLVNLRARFSLSLGNKICVSFARRMIRPPLPPCDLTHNGGRRYQILICHHPASIWRCYYNIIIIFVKIWGNLASHCLRAPIINRKITYLNVRRRMAGWLSYFHIRDVGGHTVTFSTSPAQPTQRTQHTLTSYSHIRIILLYMLNEGKQTNSILRPFIFQQFE